MARARQLELNNFRTGFTLGAVARGFDVSFAARISNTGTSMNIASSAGLAASSKSMAGACMRRSTASRRIAGALLSVCASLAYAAPFNYVANYADGTVSVVDLSTNTVVATVPHAVAATSGAAAKPGIGLGPLGVALNPAGTRGYVVNYGDSTDLKTPGTVAVIDTDPTSPTLNTVIASITVGIRPEIVAFSPNGTLAYVTNSVGNTVSVIDTTANKETAKIATTGVPIGVAFTPDGKKAYVTLADKSRVAVIDTATNAVSSTTIALSYSNPIGIVINAAGTLAYVADFGLAEATPARAGAVSVIDLSKNTEVAAIPVGVGPTGIAISPDGSRVYVTNYVGGTVSVIDTSTNKMIAQALTGLGPLGISLDSNATFAYINNSSSNTVSIFDLTANVVRGPVSVGSAPNYSAVTSSAALSVNLNQRGLNGAWYNQSTSGQGFYIDALPDTNGPGNGVLSAGWFTYDVTAAGGQRWYWLQGAVSSANPVASLTIYRGTGGNFNAAPAVTAVAVGQATLTFVDCTHGVLRYAFSDGSNRAGFIGLTRLTGNATCTTAGDSGPLVGTAQYSGSWYNPSTSGQGLVVNVDATQPAGTSLFGGWFTYAPNGQQIGGGASQSWFALQSGAGQGNSFAANIFAGTGGVFMTPPDSNFNSTQVGTANIVFTSCTAMSVTYNFSAGVNQGLSGTMSLARLGPAPPGCQ